MDWSPISDSDFDTLLAHEVSKLSQEVNEKFVNIRCQRRRVICQRDGQLDSIGLIIFGACASRLLVYDDVEEEFGIAMMPETLPIISWKLFADLEHALADF